MTSTGNNNSDDVKKSPDGRLDEALTLIATGNQHEDSDEYWKAAVCFGKAMRLIFELAIDLQPTTEEEHKIEELYQTQCREYLHRARSALIQALTNEDTMDHDQTDKDMDPKFITLTDEEAKERVQLFSTLFSKELDDQNVSNEESDADPQELLEYQSSLEQRLKSLNDSLPSTFKTDEERMKEIDRGLKGLGLNIYSHLDRQNQSSLLDSIPLSKEQQLADIIAQAKDEVHFGATTGPTGISNDDDESVSLSDDDDSILLDDDDDDGDNIGNASDDDSIVDAIPKLRHGKAIRKYVVNAQIKLTQVLALLDDLNKNKDSTKTKMADEDGIDETIEDYKTAASRAEKAEDDIERARSFLRKAKKNLFKAVTKWEVEP